MARQKDSAIPKNTPLQKWLRIDGRQKPKAYAQIYSAAEMSSLSYWLEIVFSAGIAAFGLVLNSPAVIIGAMLISPLMGPIMAAGLALAAGDLYLAIKAIANLAASISLAVAFSAFIVWLLPFHSVTNEILARTNPTLLDLGVALFSGLAGSVAVCRFGGGEAVTTLPGVAIAVALMPPLCTIGFGLGSGVNTRIMGGGGLLFLTNLVAIVASAFAVFLLVGMNSPEVRAATVQSREGEIFARKLAQGRLSNPDLQRPVTLAHLDAGHSARSNRSPAEVRICPGCGRSQSQRRYSGCCQRYVASGSACGPASRSRPGQRCGSVDLDARCSAEKNRGR